MFKKNITILIGCFLLILTFDAFGEKLEKKLEFPKTAAEITKALTFAPVEPAKDIQKLQDRQAELTGMLTSDTVQTKSMLSEVKIGALILFDTNSAKIKTNSFFLLDEYGKALQDGLSDALLIISGHTDSMGTVEYNQNLSEKRAMAVKVYLIKNYNVNPKHLKTKGFGATQPIKSNQTEMGRAINRRVEFIRVAGF